MPTIAKHCVRYFTLINHIILTTTLCGIVLSIFKMKTLKFRDFKFLFQGLKAGKVEMIFKPSAIDYKSSCFHYDLLLIRSLTFSKTTFSLSSPNILGAEGRD